MEISKTSRQRHLYSRSSKGGLCCVLIRVLVQSYGVYLSYYLHNNIFPEATSFDYAFIGGFNFSMAMLVAPFVTILTRRFGKRLPMILGIIMQAGGFISASFVKRVWQLYLSQGILIGVGVGFIFIPSISILSQWFSRKRSLANGISSAGSGIGGVIFSFATGAMIKHIGLGWSLRTTGIITFVINLTAAMLLRDRNHIIKPLQLGFDTKLLRQYKVQLLLGWSFISMLGYITLLYSLPDFAISIHLTQAQATEVVAFLNLGTAVGRPFIGLLSDRYGRVEVAGLFTFLCGILCFTIWLPSDSFGVTVLFAILSGAILGTFWMASSSLSEPCKRLLTSAIPTCRRLALCVWKWQGSSNSSLYFPCLGRQSYFQPLVRMILPCLCASKTPETVSYTNCQSRKSLRYNYAALIPLELTCIRKSSRGSPIL